MPEVRETGKDVYSLALSENEASILDRMSKYFHETPLVILQSEIMRILEVARDEMEVKDIPSLLPDIKADLPEVLVVKIPQHIERGFLDCADYQFLEASLAISLRDAMTIVCYKKTMKGLQDVVDRKGQGIRPGESTVS